MSKLLVIVGSTRPTRSADLVLPWLTTKVSEHEAFDAEIVDLRDWPLPVFAEHFGTIGDFSDPTYSEPIVKAWNNKVKSADAYVILTAEYNHSVPGGLKNAIDNVWVSFGFRNKPVAFVGYSGGQVGDAFDADGNPVNPATAAALAIVLDDLAWWANVLANARAEGQLPPASFRAKATAGA